MKKWIGLLAALTAAGALARLPHPARDIAKLEPVQTVYLYIEGNTLHMETDTGASGTGRTLTEAAADMRANAAAEIFLETAEYLILSPEVIIAEDFFTILHPSCHICFTPERPDLTTAANYLSTHAPDITLAHIRGQ